MKQLWAPWRMKYIVGAKSKGCLFCQKAKENKDKENYLVYRGKKGFIILNTFPYNNGHLMVVPYKHTSCFEDLGEEELIEIGRLIKKSVAILKKSLNPQGFNIGANLGRIAGAGIEDHIHIHIVPRWEGDTNFMPVMGKTKVIPELLEDTYKKLLKDL